MIKIRLFVFIFIFIIAGCLIGPSQVDRTVLTGSGNLTFDFTENKFEKALKSGRPTILEFSAEWCPACYDAIPVVDGLREDYGDRVNIMTVHYDTNVDLARGFGVASLPSFVFFDRKGEPVKRIVGSDEGDIRGIIDGLL